MIFCRLITSYENSQYYKRKLIRRYKKLITPGIRSNAKLVKVLQNKYNTEEIPCTEVEPVFWQHMVTENVKIAVSEKYPEGTDLEFSVFRILRDEKSEKLYKYWAILNDVDDSDCIIAVFEKNTDFVTCNSEELDLFFAVMRGIEKSDYENETSAFIVYLMWVDRFRRIRI